MLDDADGYAANAVGHKFEGKHLLAELVNVERQLLNDMERLQAALHDSVIKCGATVCGVSGKKFDPEGMTLVLLLEESHAAIHTYPESGCLFLDIFTCGTCQPLIALKHLATVLSAEPKNVKVLERGR
ncbi:adenosylmethionine decarboxylase [Pseudomonas silvicola]|nr:adenosylmethionine decarboxylase [Pseudomonas silvicola]